MITLEYLVDFCMSKKGVSQEFPFDKKTMVFKLCGKMFLLTDIKAWQERQGSVNLKNEPHINRSLREQYTSVVPGYHMNKKHWNTVRIEEEELDDSMILRLINESYEIIKEHLPEKDKKTLF